MDTTVIEVDFTGTTIKAEIMSNDPSELAYVPLKENYATKHKKTHDFLKVFHPLKFDLGDRNRNI